MKIGGHFLYVHPCFCCLNKFKFFSSFKFSFLVCKLAP
uniref:Uncharacterized protein n=1 Tax=Lotus japonicus TaxID=34305 RepID=I3T920_LOTJA|nr:unknown [Lotus japonicus]